MDLHTLVACNSLMKEIKSMESALLNAQDPETFLSLAAFHSLTTTDSKNEVYDKDILKGMMKMIRHMLNERIKKLKREFEQIEWLIPGV